MPEDSNPSSGESDDPQEKPKVRRISNKPPRKGTEEAPPKESQPEEIAQPETKADSASDAPAEGKAEPKRNNRRRRGKGKGSAGQPQEGEPSDPSTPATTESDPGSGTKPGVKPQVQQRAPQPPRRKLDPEKVAKNAWKIYLAEVSEEGVALIADNDARELARRCFRLSEIFLEEEDRRN